MGRGREEEEEERDYKMLLQSVIAHMCQERGGREGRRVRRGNKKRSVRGDKSASTFGGGEGRKRRPIRCQLAELVLSFIGARAPTQHLYPGSALEPSLPPSLPVLT